MKLVIVEDSELISAQLVRIIATEPRITIVGTATAEGQAIELIAQTQPDAVLLDLSLSPGSGLRVLEHIRNAGNKAQVLVLTNNTSSAMEAACRKWNVAGFYDKSLEAQSCLDHLFRWLPLRPAADAKHAKALDAIHLLDSPEQEVYDDLRRLAQDITDTPFALISLVDKDQRWHLSQQGLDNRDTSRAVAICAVEMLQNELLEIPDALADERYKHDPLVIGGPQLRFYAGVPLVLPTGEAIGTLCVLDTVPRVLTPTQRKSLTTVARSVVGEVELRRRLQSLEQEVARRKNAEAQILHIATRDPLTQLPNRITLLDRLTQQLKIASRHTTQFAVLFLDLDGFKLINDTLGHAAGDLALTSCANRLLSTVRESDTVARLGGDEFAVLLPEITSMSQVRQIGEKLCTALNQPVDILGHRLRLAGSIGAAMYPDDGDSADQLLNRADLAMYEAKQTGGGRVCLYHHSLDEEAKASLELITELRDALDGNELTVHFQPQVKLGPPRLCGLEVLVRWNHPVRGLVRPDQFIPLAEERGLIHQIDMQVLDMAAAQLALWDTQGLRVPRVAVNLSGKELRVGLAEDILALLSRHGLTPQRLEVEITESALVSDGVETLAVLAALRDAGIAVAVDDFGVGYSSLGQLHRLPIDCLKIDRCFVEKIGSSATDTAIVVAIITMAKAMGMHTIAEGVETLSQLSQLTALGCDCVQGYLFAKPMSAADLSAWIRDFSGQDAFNHSSSLP